MAKPLVIQTPDCIARAPMDPEFLISFRLALISAIIWYTFRI
jgi:hypothetical protein